MSLAQSAEETLQTYDRSYAEQYDQLWMNDPKYRWEIRQIERFTRIADSKVKLLDAGCGTGTHLQALRRKYDVVGMDLSPAMLAVARQKNPGVPLVEGDMMDRSLFPTERFTHVISLYDATFYNRDLETVIGNYHAWLVPGGRLFIETIDRDHITENILPAESSTFVRKEGPYVVQNLAAVTPYPHGSTLTWWELLPEDYLSVYHEEIRHHDGKVEKKEHKMYLPPLAETEKLIEQAGFRLIAKERVVNDTSEVLYVFEKIMSE